MTDQKPNTVQSRRRFLARLAAPMVILPGQALAQALPGQELENTSNDPNNPFYQPPARIVKRNVSSFSTVNWNGYFDNLANGALLVDTTARALHFWSEDGGDYRVFPTSVPMSEELTRRGRTAVTRKRVGPDWRPTKNMLKRDPTLPEYVGPGPDNPLGTHAMYLTWQYYRIHGTNDTRKIGRQSSNGCIGLYNEDIATLFDLCRVGTQVLLI